MCTHSCVCTYCSAVVSRDSQGLPLCSLPLSFPMDTYSDNTEPNWENSSFNIRLISNTTRFYFSLSYILCFNEKKVILTQVCCCCCCGLCFLLLRSGYTRAVVPDKSLAPGEHGRWQMPAHHIHTDPRGFSVRTRRALSCSQATGSSEVLSCGLKTFGDFGGTFQHCLHVLLPGTQSWDYNPSIMFCWLIPYCWG